ncbi:MAG: recombination mediator RecR [Alphaproteobacteria bacterium]|nr:recombination mediator RecR [Alphaproteobacteria bacterium]
MHKNNTEIDQLIKLLAQLPGLGPRSARRAALHLINKRTSLMQPLSAALNNVFERIKICNICNNIDTHDPCNICCDKTRDKNTLIIVEEVADLWALERSMILRAKYHVLGGHLAPLDGITAKNLHLATLPMRLEQERFTEIIIAVNATIEGQTTAHYIKNLLKDFAIKITRLARGVPLGGELDYLDEGTLAQAIDGRTNL